MKRKHPIPRVLQGFSLVEVMVAVVVICVGLLGIAKMQAMALSNTTMSRQRSLAAIEAASIASAMHSNRAVLGPRNRGAPSVCSITGKPAASSPRATGRAAGANHRGSDAISTGLHR